MSSYSCTLFRYAAKWTPKRPGLYNILCQVDGYALSRQTEALEVRASTAGSHAPAQDDTLEDTEEPSRTSKRSPSATAHNRAHCPTVASFRGVRVRSHATLNAPQIGVVPRGATITYEEIVRNADGVWIRLTDEARSVFCQQRSGSQVTRQQYLNHDNCDI